MKINNNNDMFANATFLGGTCATSTWRSQLIPLLGENVPYFDPQLPPGAWNDEAAAAEDACKAEAKVMVFVISPEGLGTYSGWEIRETAMLAPERMIFAAIGDLGDQTKGVGKIAKGLRKLGVTVCESLEDVAAAVNARYSE